MKCEESQALLVEWTPPHKVYHPLGPSVICGARK